MAKEKKINVTRAPEAMNAKEADVIEIATEGANAESIHSAEAVSDQDSQEKNQTGDSKANATGDSQAQQGQAQQAQQTQNTNDQGASETHARYADRQAPPYVKHVYAKTMKSHTASKIVWGLIFVAAAAAIVLGGLNLINIEGFGMWDFIWAAIFVVVFLFSACHLFWFGIFFPIAGALLLFGEKFIDIHFPMWPMLGGALFLSIGFHIIFSGIKRGRRKFANAKYESGYSEFTTDYGQFHQYEYQSANTEGSQNAGSTGGGNASDVRGASVVRAEASFNNTVKYINSDCLKRAEVTSSFAAMDVYFDNTKLADNNAAIIVSVSFGSLNLYLPKEWSVSVNVENSFSRVEEYNSNYNVEKTAHVVIFGDVSFSGMTITYI